MGNCRIFDKNMYKFVHSQAYAFKILISLRNYENNNILDFFFLDLAIQEDDL